VPVFAALVVSACGGGTNSSDAEIRQLQDELARLEREAAGNENQDENGGNIMDIILQQNNIPENPASDFEHRTITGGVEITSYIGSATEVNIPGVIAGANVVSISRAFENRSAITAVIIPDTVTTITDRAFLGCTGLKSISLPSSLTTIGESAFEGSGLESISIPDGVEVISERAFANMGLMSAVLPENLKEIGNGAFANTRLTEIIIPDNVTRIGNGAFVNTDLTSVLLSGSLKDIDHGVFANTAITSITFPAGLERIGASAFANTQLTNVAIPDSVTRMGSGGSRRIWEVFKCCATGWETSFPFPQRDNDGVASDSDRPYRDDWTPEEIDDYYRSLPACCDNRTLVSATYKGVTYNALRPARSISWDLPQELYDNFTN